MSSTLSGSSSTYKTVPELAANAGSRGLPRGGKGSALGVSLEVSRGRRTRNSAPCCGALMTSIVPPIACTRSRTITKPSPLPSMRRRSAPKRLKGWNSWL